MLDIYGFSQPGVPVFSDPAAPSDAFMDLRSGGVVIAQITKTGAILGGEGLQLGGTASRLIGFHGAPGVTKPAALTDIDPGIVDSVFGGQEKDVILSLRITLNELESRLQSLGLLA